ncbi:MAG: ROK family protein [Candidatus Pseudobacter hemicellulosilyticus]|uniref:ROK family protein n=1 Tax=Candidatus Pseudobacter hemicellulosilyticus TaxID=3121375 RepID=A0AAJ5WNZ8_9BACT|nr:MAG: ROK family protein [Pseudobacter sp.]
MKDIFVLGVDIGGSHISAALVNLENAAVIPTSAVRLKTDPAGSARYLIDVWARAIEASYEHTGITEKRIGIAMPGPFDYEEGISRIIGLAKFESLYGLNVKELLAERLEISPANIEMINDASAFLLGEVKAGAARGFRDAAGITLGTGLGSAGYFNGVLHEGDCWCTPYREGRAEDYLCSRWFVQEYEKATGNKVAGVRELIDLAPNNPVVIELFNTFGSQLAEVLLMKYPPSLQQVIVVGGNIAKAWKLFMPAAETYFWSKGKRMNLQPAQLGEQAAIIGAAFLHAD